MKVELIRLSADKTDPQLGVLRFNGAPRVLTLELPDLDNQQKISCIPKGSYSCHSTSGRRTTGGMTIPRTYEVMNVPGRSGVLFHVGNTRRDSNGCILVGQRFDIINGELAVLNSQMAFKQFLDLLNGTVVFELEIK